MKYAYFDPNSAGKVLQWIDTEAADYNLPDWAFLHVCTDAEWKLDHGQEWSVSSGAVIPYTAPEGPNQQVAAAVLRMQRDTAIAATDWLVQRHRDEADMGSATTLTANQYADLLVYRQALRDLPESADFPQSAMPATPPSLTSVLGG